MLTPPWFGSVTTFVLGLCIGSFLNVVIWRLPRNGSLMQPEWSYCPHCSHRLAASDLIPLLSYLYRGRKCRYCGKPISSRYFWVELATALLFLVLYTHFKQSIPNMVAMLMFGTILVPVFCTDLELFEIPGQLNILAYVVAIGRDLYGVFTHEPGHALVWHVVPVSIIGGVVGLAIFGTVRVLGWVWKRTEAMGLGDVLLARAMGALLISVVPVGDNPLRLVPIWVLISCGSGAIIGPVQIWFRKRAAQAALAAEPEEPDAEEEDAPEDDSSFALELLDIGYVLWLQDLWEYAAKLFSRKERVTPQIEEDDWVPAATAVPFGPFMVVGFVATLFFGEPLTAMYLAFAVPKAVSAGALIYARSRNIGFGQGVI